MVFTQNLCEILVRNITMCELHTVAGVCDLTYCYNTLKDVVDITQQKLLRKK